MKRYQVVIQLLDTFFATFDELVAFEDKLIASLPRTHDVDGHDIGAGTINFFVYTNSPRAVLTNFRKYLGTNKVEKMVRIAFREGDGDQFEILWPKGDTHPFSHLNGALRGDLPPRDGDP